MGFPENAWKPQIWPVSLSQNTTKIKKKTQDHNHNLISSEGDQDTAA